jgi:hypothetical protein
VARRSGRLWLREARLITKELRMLGVPSHVIAKIWTAVIGVVVIFVGWVILYDSTSRTARTMTPSTPAQSVPVGQQVVSTAMEDLSSDPNVLSDVTVMSPVFGRRTLSTADYRTWQTSISSVRIRNHTGFTLQSVTLECLPGGDAQPIRELLSFVTPLESGHSEELVVNMLACRRGSSFRVMSVANGKYTQTLLASEAEAAAVRARHAPKPRVGKTTS